MMSSVILFFRSPFRWQVTGKKCSWHGPTLSSSLLLRPMNEEVKFVGILCRSIFPGISCPGTPVPVYRKVSGAPSSCRIMRGFRWSLGDTIYPCPRWIKTVEYLYGQAVFAFGHGVLSQKTWILRMVFIALIIIVVRFMVLSPSGWTVPVCLTPVHTLRTVHHTTRH
jgi:hypothetical protein